MNTHAVYTAKLLALAMVAAAAGKLAMFNSVGCDAFDHDRDDYMAYCNTAAHGHYDHAAFLFDLEPGVREHVDAANVLVLGSSRIQTALSTQAFLRFEREHPDARPYLMGFGDAEQDRFSAAVLRKLHPVPKVVVINADPFFDDSASAQAQFLLENPGTARANAMAMRVWHWIDAAQCAHGADEGAVSRMVCGGTGTLYRSRIDGRWIFPAARKRKYDVPVMGPLPDEAALSERYATNARTFLKALPVALPCTVITSVPSRVSSESLGRAIAARLGADFIDPRVDSLGSSDGSHLDSESAERWSAAFLAELAPVLKECL
jgi:hypothetical protein